MNRRRSYTIPRCAAATVLWFLASCGGPRPATTPAAPPGSEAARPAAPVRTGKEPIVRVLVLDAQKSVTVSIPGAFDVEAGDGGTRHRDGSRLKVTASGAGVRVAEGSRILGEGESVTVTPTAGGRIYVNGKPYRGGLRFYAADRKVLTLNVIGIDDYLKGVLPAEIGVLRPELHEAYRAQAIVSRSYAISKLDEKRGERYDLRATIMDQVYRGVQGEHAEASRAVDETRGMVVLWRGETVRTYYSSCCGGMTADIRIAWPWKEPSPCLEGVRDAAPGDARSFCRSSRHFRWRVHWSGDELRRTLLETIPAELGTPLPRSTTIRDIAVLETSPSGRAMAIEIVTDTGRYTVAGDRIRWVLRPPNANGAILKSTMFKMTVAKRHGTVESVDLVGGGNGHGVGLCQTGAIGMATAGHGAEEIVAHYYPGATIGRVYH